MGFATPILFWAGLGLAAIPVVLHLIMRKKASRVVFPALQLVKQRYEVRRRRLRLQHILLMLLRTLLFVLIGLGLARPQLEWGGRFATEEAPVAAVLIFDTSPRMAYRYQNRTRLEVAQDLGLWLLTQLPRDSDIAVMDSRNPVGAFAVDRGSAKTQIQRLQLSAVADSMPRLIERAIALLESSDKMHGEVYVFTDLTVAGWPSSQFAGLRERLIKTKNTAFYLLDVGIKEPQETGIREVKLSEEVNIEGMPLEFQVDCRRWGSAETRTVALYLEDQGARESGERGQPLKRAEVSLSLPANGLGATTIRLAGLTAGVHQGYLQIEGDSPLPFNDRWYFTVQVRSSIPVLIAASSPAERRAVYLSQALAPESLRRAGMARFQCTVIDIDGLSGEDLTKYQAVFLLDPAFLPNQSWERIKTFVEAGGGAAFFFGRSLGKPEQWNIPPGSELLGGQILVQARAPGGDVYLRPTGYDHPLLKPFKALAGSVPWDLFPVYRYWVMDPLAENAQVILNYSDGRPCIVERIVGKGRVLTVTTPVSDLPDSSPWNLLPMGQAWPFVILANQMALYLAGTSDFRTNYLAGEAVRIVVEDRGNLTGALLDLPPDVLNSPKSEAIFPIRLSFQPDKKEILITATERIGHYRVRGGGKDEEFRFGFSVNPPGQLMELDRISQGELGELFKDVSVQVAHDRSDLVRQLTASRTGLDATPYVLLLMVIVLAMEQVVANRFYRPSQQETK
ncbi:MAG: BatA domain-containing protein [Thermogutta sp.]